MAKRQQAFIDLSKTQFTVFLGKEKYGDHPINLPIEDNALERTYNSKFLGVTNDKLTLSDHIFHVRKFQRHWGLFSGLENVLIVILLTLYYSFLHPYLTYIL